MSGTVAWQDGEVSIARHGEGPTLVVLAHGAGGNMHTPSMRAYAEGLAENGIAAVRFNFAYAEAGKRGPDRQEKLLAVWRAVADAVRGDARRLILGGRSMGGRMASNLVAEGYAADGLVFLAYPLHPPGKPERIRDAHLRDITCPTLWLQGTRDPFARPDLLERTVSSLPGATLHRVEGGDHSHKVAGRTQAEVIAELVDVTLRWL